MGEFFKSWITAVATASIVCGIIMMLSPSEKNTKYIKIGVTLYMLLVMFVPFVSGSGFDNSLSELEGVLRRFDFSETDYQDTHSLALNEFLGSKLEEEIDGFLKDSGIEADELAVEVGKKEGVYTLIRVYIYCENADSAAALVRERFQIDENVIAAREKT